MFLLDCTIVQPQFQRLIILLFLLLNVTKQLQLNNDGLLDNNCLISKTVKYIKSGNSGIFVENLGIISILNQLMNIYSESSLLDKITFDTQRNLVCGPYDHTFSLGIPLDPNRIDIQEYSDKNYVMSIFLSKTNNSYNCIFRTFIADMNICNKRLQNISQDFGLTLQPEYPTDESSFWLGKRVGVLNTPLILKNKELRFLDQKGLSGDSVFCLRNDDIQGLKEMSSFNKRQASDMLSSLLIFLNEILTDEAEEKKVLTTNRADFVNLFNSYKSHNSKLLNFFDSSIAVTDRISLAYDPNPDAELSAGMLKYIKLIEIMDFRKTFLLESDNDDNRRKRDINMNRRRRRKRSLNIFDYIFSSGEINEILNKYSIFNKNFRNVDLNTHKLNSNINKIASITKLLAKKENANLLDVKDMRKSLLTLLADRFNEQTYIEAENSIINYQLTAKLNYLLLISLSNQLKTLKRAIFALDKNHCFYIDGIVCSLTSPLFFVDKEEVKLLITGYRLESKQLYYLTCLPVDGKMFVGNNKLYSIQNGILQNIGNSTESFPLACLLSSGKCNDLYVNNTPNVFGSCNIITSLRKIYMVCVNETTFLTGGTQQSVWNKVKSFSIADLPFSYKNQTYSIQNIPLITGYNKNNFFSKHRSAEARMIEKVNFGNVLFHSQNRTPTNLTLEMKFRNLVIPEQYEITHYTLYVVLCLLLSMSVLLCIYCACKSTRVFIEKMLLCLFCSPCLLFKLCTKRYKQVPQENSNPEHVFYNNLHSTVQSLIKSKIQKEDKKDVEMHSIATQSNDNGEPSAPNI